MKSANVINFDQLETELVGRGIVEDTPEAQEWNADLSADINFMIPLHFGVAAEIQRWILDTSVKKQPAIALAATLSVLSVIVGRHNHCDGIKGNIISVCLAESGEGKDHPLKCVQKILDSIDMGHKVTGQAASGAALMDTLDKNPSVVMILDEIGHYFTGINSKGASQYSREIMPMITELYTSAFHKYREKSRKGVDGRIFTEPNLSVLGMTTERQIIDGLRTADVSDGSLARFFVLFGNNNVKINENADRVSSRDVPQSIIDKLEVLKSKYSGNDELFMSSTELYITDSYRALKMRLMIDFNDKGIACGTAGGNTAIFKPFYARLAVKSVCMSMLIDQCQSEEVLSWCANIAEKAQDVFIKKFIHLASDNENERQMKIIERAIKEAGKKGITSTDLSSATRQITPIQKKSMLDELIEVGKVFSELKRVGKSTRSSMVYYWRK